MQQFKIGKTGFKKIKQRSLAISLTMIIAVLFFVFYTDTTKNPDGSHDFGVTLYVVPFLLVIFGFSIYRSRQKQKKVLEDYCVTITDDQISLQQHRARPYSLGFMEIKEIMKTQKGHFIIRGEGKGSQITIPSYVDDYADLEARLQKLGPITVREKDPVYQRYPVPVVVLFMGLAVCVYTLSNKIVVAVCGVLVTGMMILSFYKIMISKTVPPRAKRSAWTFLIVIASIIYVMFLKLTA